MHGLFFWKPTTSKLIGTFSPMNEDKNVYEWSKNPLFCWVYSNYAALRHVYKIFAALQQPHGSIAEMTLVLRNGKNYIQVNRAKRVVRRNLDVPPNQIEHQKHQRTRNITMDVIGSFKNWRSYRKTVAELGALSNRELDDLGISRSEIPYIARKAR